MNKKIVFGFLAVVFLLVFAVVFFLIEKGGGSIFLCAKEGEKIGNSSMPEKCCGGLKAVGGFPGGYNGDCNLFPPPTGLQTCAECGNGKCDIDNGENKCNCSEDCIAVSSANRLSYAFTGCNDRQNKSGSKYSDSIELFQEDSDLSFKQIFNTYCGSEKEMFVEHIVSGYEIEIKETFDPENGVARCICPLEATGKISDLPKGVYKVKFIYNNKYIGETKTIGERQIEIK